MVILKVYFLKMFKDSYCVHEVLRNEKDPKNESKQDLNFVKRRITYIFF